MCMLRPTRVPRSVCARTCFKPAASSVVYPLYCQDTRGVSLAVEGLVCWLTSVLRSIYSIRDYGVPYLMRDSCSRDNNVLLRGDESFKVDNLLAYDALPRCNPCLTRCFWMVQ